MILFPVSAGFDGTCLLDQPDPAVPAHLEGNAECSGDFAALRADFLGFLDVSPFL